MKGLTRGHLAVMAVLLVLVALLQGPIDARRKELGLVAPPLTRGEIPGPAALMNFREFSAQLLWIKADDLFHQGKFEEVVPLIYIIVALDPHFIDVYATGAWHMDYNFVDKNERSDRRLIPNAIALLERGVRHNSQIYELYFELAFTHYINKIKDYDKALYWTKRALGKKTWDNEETPRYVYHTLAHAYELNGQIDKCLETWKSLRDRARRQLDRYFPGMSDEQIVLALKNPALFDSPEAIAWWDYDICARNYQRTLTRKLLRADLPSRRLQANLTVNLKKVSSRKLELSGKINIPDGARLEVLLRDIDWKERARKDFAWRLDNQTIFYDSPGVYDGEFVCDIDLTDGPRFYPLKADKYELIVTLNPRNQPSQVQDRIGWSGEGLDDPRYLDTSVKGLRQLTKKFILTREQIL